MLPQAQVSVAGNHLVTQSLGVKFKTSGHSEHGVASIDADLSRLARKENLLQKLCAKNNNLRRSMPAEQVGAGALAPSAGDRRALGTCVWPPRTMPDTG